MENNQNKLSNLAMLTLKKRETIILAVKLNRTVVMPPFYKHRSDPSPGEISYPWRKIDEDQLRQYISVSSLENFQQKCNGKFDVSFTAREDSGEVRAFCLY